MPRYPENTALNLARLTERTREARGGAQRHPVIQLNARGECVATVNTMPVGTKVAPNDDGCEPTLVGHELAGAMMGALMRQADTMIATDANITVTIGYEYRTEGWRADKAQWRDGSGAQICEIEALRGDATEHGLDAIAYDHVEQRLLPATAGTAYAAIGKWLLDTTKHGRVMNGAARVEFRPGARAITVTDVETGNAFEAAPDEFAPVGLTA